MHCRRRASKRIFLAAIAVTAAAACGPQTNEQDNVVTPAEDNVLAAAPPPLPPEPAVLTREDILLAALRAASATAIGRNDSEAQKRIDGSRFEFAMRFGCATEAAAPDARIEAKMAADPAGTPAVQPKEAPSRQWQSSMGWRYDAERKRLEVTAAPDIDLADPIAAQLAGQTYEAVNGFWIPKPWLLDAACPATSGSLVTKPADGPWVGIAQFHGPEESRVQRRESRSYQKIESLPPDKAQELRAGFDLVLSGRLRSLASGKVVSCIGNGPNAAPTCIISAEIQKVELRRVDTDSLVAEWSYG
ncbi:hypothetical protein C7I55_27555 [Sphingomonas deserti]|uniref:Lipoprotein n=2 Tax=Allosphingosinicella deserti TaxID=2116704 RepID=A0A2P7QDX9_9SPHN|nr:hypothetical protein C7I55_27555 [Sphingomonas deserti]